MTARRLFPAAALIGLGFLAGLLTGPWREATYQRLWGESTRTELAKEEAYIRNLLALNNALLNRCQENR